MGAVGLEPTETEVEGFTVPLIDIPNHSHSFHKSLTLVYLSHKMHFEPMSTLNTGDIVEERTRNELDHI
jgi:hypothetical protein